MVKNRNTGSAMTISKSNSISRKISKSKVASKSPKFSMRLKQTVQKNVSRDMKNEGAKKKSKKTKSKKSILKLDKSKVTLLKADMLKNSITSGKNKEVNKHIEYIMPSQSITNNVVTLALKALFKASEYNKKKKMFEEESPVFIEINCIKIQDSKGTISFAFPHSTIPSTGEVCLITSDLKKGKKPDHEPTISHWEEILKKAGVKQVKTILPLRQLRVEYDQFELKRRLLTQHDFIMVDTKVLSHASHVLGKPFFKKHNMFIPVRLSEKNLDSIRKNIEKGLHTSILRLSEGSTSTIQIGHMGMPLKKIKENILSLVEQLNSKFPGGEANIRTLSVKLPLSLSLPLYVTLRPNSSIQPPSLPKIRPKNSKIVEGELSTIPGTTVSVTPDGIVRIIKNKKDTSDSDMQSDAEDNKKAEDIMNEDDNKSESEDDNKSESEDE